MMDDTVSDRESERIFSIWETIVMDPETRGALGDFVKGVHMGIRSDPVKPLPMGAFNAVLLVQFQAGNHLVLKIPRPGYTMFPEEKTRAEVATMQYLTMETMIPVPFVLHHGTRSSCPKELGPFLIMEFVKDACSMGDFLAQPRESISDVPVLKPDFDDFETRSIYADFAKVLLQLSKTNFDKIGCISEQGEDEYGVSDRPLTMDMNDLVLCGGLPRSKLSQKPFTSTKAYFNRLADLKLDHLIHQRNNAIDDADDCRRKFVGRILFQRLARKGRLSLPELEHGPFRLVCDDMRPSNILVDAQSRRTKAVIDWEFSYAGPAEFSRMPPWSLLLRRPDYMDPKLEVWPADYERRLDVFLQELRKVEDAEVQDMPATDRLSAHMEQTWKSGYFWVLYLLQRSFAFDDIYWKFVDETYYGKSTVTAPERWKERLEQGLLDDDERERMEALVLKKVSELDTEELSWNPFEEGAWQPGDS